MSARDLIYARLGFRTCKAPIPEPRKGMKAQAMESAAFWCLGWRDRLRVLWSGKLMCSIATSADAVPKFYDSTSAFSVLSPNFPLDPEPDDAAANR